ncbi:Protein CBG25207 [Caenorhabditis briggsae]|uniref:Protein CBG25207 n=1 Tax=Caenorhabditis briggsae TaxID=6238 RepID=B6IJG5_CAEBR|nr:Protein CBG25207 [Caenorhabditis briggsae]CAS00045.1 Protein CBG25207 [Caenorhabditis briggsae]
MGGASPSLPSFMAGPLERAKRKPANPRENKQNHNNNKKRDAKKSENQPTSSLKNPLKTKVHSYFKNTVY